MEADVKNLQTNQPTKKQTKNEKQENPFCERKLKYIKIIQYSKILGQDKIFLGEVNSRKM